MANWRWMVVPLLLVGLPAAAETLNGKIETAAANYKLGSARIGVSILDLETGARLADIRAAEPFTPASNMKLLTSGAALLVLGKDFIFRTELILDGTRLVIKGCGDPALGDPFILARSPEKMTVDGLVATLAASVKSSGVESISQVVVDDSVFDREYIHPTWPKDQLDRWYCAEVSGLNFHTNVLSVFPAPASAGINHPPTYSLEPSAPWMEITNRARTIAGSKNSVWLSREATANRFTMYGEVGIPTRIPVEITLHDVPTVVGHLIAAALPKAGVKVAPSEGAQTVRLVSAGEHATGRTVAVVTTTMQDVLDRCNGDSQNLYAETMIKLLGHHVTGEPGSWSSGASVMRMTLAEPPPKGLGPECAATTQIGDGSGMSREDRVSPLTLTKWLDRLQRDESVGPAFVNSLASPEQKESIRRRFKDRKLVSDLRAKTGTINGVRCLSGFLTDPANGHRLAFSIMINDLKEGEQALQARDFQEDVVMLADKWLAAQRGQAGVGER